MWEGGGEGESAEEMKEPCKVHPFYFDESHSPTHNHTCTLYIHVHVHTLYIPVLYVNACTVVCCEIIIFMYTQNAPYIPLYMYI